MTDPTRHEVIMKGCTPEPLAKLRSRCERLINQISNGRRYYPFDGQVLAKLPDDANLLPSADALQWHGQNVFLAG